MQGGLRGGPGASGGAAEGIANQMNSGPITGENFRDFSDRLRDVEEMIDDPALRAEAARIREQARAMRAEFKRHSKQPNWSLVDELIAQPLNELSKRVSEELLKRESKDSLVPIDRDPVPPEFEDDVKRYYENLGRGKRVAEKSDE